MLPRRELLQGSRQAAALEPLIDLAETVLRTWEPCWTPFLAPDLREEAEARLASLSELRLGSEGGHPAAERRRLWLERSETALAEDSGDGAAEGSAAGLMGLEIAGNFLFDPAAPEEFSWLHAYSPYHHVVPGTTYPAVLFTTAEGDTRVDPLHARKMAALLQHAAVDQHERPVLLWQAGRAGHGVGKPASMRVEEGADVLSFLWWQLGGER